MASLGRRAEDVYSTFLVHRLRWQLKIFGPEDLSETERVAIAREVQAVMRNFITGSSPAQLYKTDPYSFFFELKSEKK